MTNSGRFSALNAKICAMHSQLLMNGDYIRLLECANLSDIKREIAGFIGTDMEYNSTQPAFLIEIQLQKYELKKLLKLRNYLSGSYRAFFDALMLKYTLSDLKIILRALQRKGKLSSLKNRILTEDAKSFDLRENDTIKSFVERLQDSPYYEILRAYLDEPEDTILFYLEMNIDKFYYQNIMEKSVELDSADEKSVREIIGTQIDQLNIIWIYRGLKFFSMIPEELFNFSIIGGDSLNYSRIKELCYVKSLAEFESKVIKTQYGFLFEADEDVDLYMHRRAKRHVYFKCKKAYKDSQRDIRKLLAYFYLSEYEIEDISSIMEGKRFGLTKEQTAKYLIRKLEGGDTLWL